MPVDFGDRQDRMRIRWLIEDVLRGSVVDYNGPGITVALPSTPDKHILVRVLELMGFRNTCVAYFPLGTDSPPDHLRHQMHKWGFDQAPGSYWLFYKFEPHGEGDHV